MSSRAVRPGIKRLGDLEAGTAGCASDRDIANEWMKGLLSSDQVIAGVGIQLNGRFREDFLARRLDLDSARMQVNVGLFEVLRVLRAEAMVVVAADNMDCFARVFEHARNRRRRLNRERESLADWAVICDDLICCGQTGALKSEDPQAFFGPSLTAHGLGFTDAVLIDDRADNCATFTREGGAAIQWKMGTSELSEVTDQLRHWLIQDTQAAGTPAMRDAAS